jgi:hypothetical protein
LYRATWVRFSSRPRALQPKRQQRHGALRCSKRARCAAVPIKFAASVESHRATWASFSSRPSVLQPKRLHRHGSFCRSERVRHAATPTKFVWVRGIASCDVVHLFKPPKGSSDQAPVTVWCLRRSKRARHAAVPSTGGWLAWSCIVRRGPAFQAGQGPFRPSAGNGMVLLAAVGAQNTPPCRLQALG